MPDVSGSRTSGNVLADQRVRDFHKAILLLEPDAAPITVVTKNTTSAAAKDPKFSWFEDTLEGRFDAVNNGAGYTSTATSIVVDTGALFSNEDLVVVPRTGEVISVTSISTNTLTVERGVGASTAAALVDDDPLYIIGTAAEEGDTSQGARSDNPTKVDNYTQIFKTSIEATGTWLSSSNETTPHDWRHQQKKAGIEHKKDIEFALIFGTAGTFTGAGGGPRRSTGGILEFATSNNQDASGALSEAEWETFMQNVFRYGSKKRTLFASRLVTSVLNGYSRGKLETTVGDSTYGVHVMKYLSPFGEVNVVTHNHLEGAVYGGYGIAVDFAAPVKYRYLAGDGPGGSRDTKLHENRQAPDRDGRLDEFITECGLQFPQPERHGVLYGVTS